MSKREQFFAAARNANSDQCITWPFAVRKSSGYGAHNASGKNYDAHRYACEMAHGKPPEAAEAAHKCGNKLCVNPNHLYWADHKTNMDDAKRHGTLRGGGRYRQRFFPEDVEAIVSSNDSLLSLAARYNTDVAYIGRLRRQHLASAA
jgi:hypothetical protein